MTRNTYTSSYVTCVTVEKRGGSSAMVGRKDVWPASVRRMFENPHAKMWRKKGPRRGVASEVEELGGGGDEALRLGLPDELKNSMVAE